MNTITRDEAGVTDTSETRAILAAADLGDYDAESSLDELEELAETAGAKAVAKVIQKRPALDAATVLGDGKINEIAALCKDYDAELLVFDTELTASQIRNIEDITKVRVIDRTMLILDIFAMRAVSDEGKLQVELAQLRYRLPRLAGMGTALSRLGGGIGTRGPGETQLETDKRHIHRRITALEKRLKELEKRRTLSRARRRKDNIPVCAIVGYTNAGKSTLLNYLTGAGVFAEDKLFATLDLTSRAVKLPDGRTLILTDTVGLIRRLPHHLVEAFKSTLEEAAGADIILHVSDISDPEAAEKTQTAQELLAELGCGEIPVVSALNKCDRVPFNIPEDDTTVKISAKTGAGIARMLQLLADNLPRRARRLTLLIPYPRAGVIAEIRESGVVYSEEYLESGIRVTALVDERVEIFAGEIEED